MPSPGRAHPPHNPMVSTGPHRTGCDRGGRPVRARPAKHHGGGCPLHLFPIIPWPTQRARTTAPRTVGIPQGSDRGARQSAGSTSGPISQPSLGKSHGCGPLSRQVLPARRRLASTSQRLWPVE